MILYVNLKKVPDELSLKKKLLIKDIKFFERDIAKYSNDEILVEKNVSYYLFNTLKKKNNVNVINDLCKDLKSIKNKTEIRNTRLAHLRDGVALVKFFLLARKKPL